MKPQFAFSIVVILALSHSLSAQNAINEGPVFLTQISAHGGARLPAAMMAQKYGVSYALGGGVHIKNKKNIVLGAEYTYCFGDALKNRDSYLQNMRTTDNMIIAQDGTPATIISNMRGYSIQVNVGKIFPVIGPNVNSGLLVRIGAGYLQHKVHFEARRQEVPQLEGDMRQYYDQMTSGAMIAQFVGYQHYSNSRLANFYIGLEGYQAFTQNRRSYNIDLGGADNKQRLDMLYGIRIGWMWLIYKRKPQDFYFH